MSQNWREINARLNSMTEQELWDVLNEERVGQRRHTVLLRLHQRVCVVRAARERAEILGVQPHVAEVAVA